MRWDLARRLPFSVGGPWVVRTSAGEEGPETDDALAGLFSCTLLSVLRVLSMLLGARCEAACCKPIDGPRPSEGGGVGESVLARYQ